ncbi:MAG: methyltransferase [Proteobacteria bacterium]|nr:methyltransferase [Pseudomonadota bacterium]
MKEIRQEPAEEMMRIISAKWLSKPVYIATHLGIADILADGPMPVSEIASACGCFEPFLYRLMRALAGFGIFVEGEGRVFNLTPMAEMLQQGKMRSIALMFLSDWHERAWNALPESIQNGSVAFEDAHGMSAFDWLENHPKDAQVFNEANAIKAMTSYAGITQVYDFTTVSTVTDVGGGTGGLMSALLQTFPTLKGSVAEQVHVLQQAEEFIKGVGLDERCELIACDFFREVPGGSEIYILANVLHDWDDSHCIQILKNCRKAMEDNSKLLIIEMIIPPGNGPSIAKLLDIEMMVMGSGKERTESEYKELLQSAGLMIKRIVSVGPDLSILECA